VYYHLDGNYIMMLTVMKMMIMRRVVMRDKTI